MQQWKTIWIQKYFLRKNLNSSSYLLFKYKRNKKKNWIEKNFYILLIFKISKNFILFKNYPFEKLFAYFVTTNLNPDFINNIDLLTRLFQLLGSSWKPFAEQFELLALKSLSDGRLIQSKFPAIKTFFIRYFKEILSKKSSIFLALNFENFQECLFSLLKVFLADSDTGVYETTADFLLCFYLEQNLFLEVLTAKNPLNAELIISMLDYLEQIREKNSILVIRELELILNFIEKLNLWQYLKITLNAPLSVSKYLLRNGHLTAQKFKRPQINF